MLARKRIEKSPVEGDRYFYRLLLANYCFFEKNKLLIATRYEFFLPGQFTVLGQSNYKFSAN